jgi:ATP-binding cassette, subfamily B, bacterial
MRVNDVERLVWPLHKLGEALEALANRAGLLAFAGKNIADKTSRSTLDPTDVLRAHRSGEGKQSWDVDAVGDWIIAAAEFIGVEAAPIDVPLRDIHTSVAQLGPAIVMFDNTNPVFLMILSSRAEKLAILTPEYTVERIDASLVAERLCQPAEALLGDSLARLLDHAQIPASRRHAVRQALLVGRFGAEHVPGLWHLRLPPTVPLRTYARSIRLGRRIVAFFVAHIAGWSTWVLAWYTLGRSMFLGDTRWDRIIAASLLLLTAIPLRQLATWMFNRLGLEVSAFLRRRLLAGALALNIDEARRKGAGVLLGHVLESELVEVLGLRGGLLGFIAVFELFLAAFLMHVSEFPTLQWLLLGGWVTFALAAFARYHALRREWAQLQLGLTHDLIERMVGHRTRIAQERAEEWHRGEDEGLARYLESSRKVDQWQVLLTTGLARGYILAALTLLGWFFVAGGATPVMLSFCLVAALAARGALTHLLQGLSHLSGAAIAYHGIAEMLAAANEQGNAARVPPTAMPNPESRLPGQIILDAREITFRHRHRAEDVLRSVHLQIAARDRILLEGPSGAGKSTLGAIVAGLRSPNSGLLLLDGLDRYSLGNAQWHRRVAAAPQFHENHIITGTLAFNILMGRHWPPRSNDLAEALAVCHELGLDDLLRRMPAGIEQMVGETGWQLSHGEKSRIYVARALLQKASIIVLDESFAALDPETMVKVMQCVFKRAPAMLVIAHP